MPPSHHWISPDHHARRRPFLLARAQALKAVRRWFDERGFLEVETAALQRAPCLETHLHGIPARVSSGDGRTAALHLHTSPEFACKKLLGAGEERLFYLGKVWRDAESSDRHHPEFTLLEWYRKGASYEALMADCVSLIRAVATALDSPLWRWKGRMADVFADWERISVPQALAARAGVDVMASLKDPSSPDAAVLRRAAQAAGLRVAPDDSWGDIFTKLMVDRVEPGLGAGRPVILCDYPLPEAALARRKPEDSGLAERFELYIAGLELANGFSELTDPAEQRARFMADQALKQRLYGFSYPIDEDLLEALPRMGDCAGIALGFDRMVMLATGAAHIEDVIWSPVETGFG